MAYESEDLGSGLRFGSAAYHFVLRCGFGLLAFVEMWMWLWIGIEVRSFSWVFRLRLTGLFQILGSELTIGLLFEIHVRCFRF